MNDYRERMEASGLLAGFEDARRSGDKDTMKRLLESANFAPLEIESILWSKGDIGPAPTEEYERRRFWDAVIGRLGIALISGVCLGCAFAYFSSGLAAADGSPSRAQDVLARDFRSPKEAYYRPFVWGFAIGTVGGLVAGPLLLHPVSRAFRRTHRDDSRHFR